MKVLYSASKVNLLQYVTGFWTMNITEETVCQDCGEVFSDERGFKRHFRQYQTKNESEKNMKTCTADIVRVKKEEIGAFNCDTCGKIFTKKRYLTQHKRAHAAARQEYNCQLCDKVYTSNQNLRKHITKVHPNPRKLEDENVGFMLFDSPMPSLKVNKKKKMFKCEQCTYESDRKRNLERHIETHTGNRPKKTGRPKKSPGELSSVTKRIYAKRSLKAFMEDMRKNNLEKEIMKLMGKDS